MTLSHQLLSLTPLFSAAPPLSMQPVTELNRLVLVEQKSSDWAV